MATFAPGYWDGFKFDGKYLRVSRDNYNILIAPEDKVLFVIMKPIG